MMRLGLQTQEMSLALPYKPSGYSIEEIARFQELTAQALDTVARGFLMLLEGYECAHPGLVPPAVLEPLR